MEYKKDTNGQEMLVLNCASRNAEENETKSNETSTAEVKFQNVLNFGFHRLHRQNLLLVFYQLKDFPGPCVGSNTIVMMEWERPYMEACVDALKISPSDSVLEIGFGYSCLSVRRLLGVGSLILP